MKKEFVPYDIALALKELGFDEECLRYYFNEHRMRRYNNYTNDIFDDDCYIKNDYSIITDSESNCTAPLYQQAFRWFREVHNIDCRFHTYTHYKEGIRTDWMYDYIDGNKTSFDGYNKSYQEAQDACLRKLIEIVKEK